MKSDFDTEFEGFQNDKKEINETLEHDKKTYAENIKNNLGRSILNELSNPTLKPIKHSKKQRILMWWKNFKMRLNNYFFNS